MCNCKYCGKEFDSTNKLRGHYGRCKKGIEHKNMVLNYEFLYTNLVENKFSANHIAIHILKKEYGAGAIIDQAKKLGIKTYTVKESNNLDVTKTKRASTNVSRYGAENVLGKNTSKYHKRNATVKAKYGVDNVFQLESIKEKAKETMLANYGVPHTVYLPNRYRNNGRKSKEHIIIENILEVNNINYVSEPVQNFKEYNNILKRQYNPRPDIIIEEAKLIIEIYGDFWHANPKLYKDNDLIPLWGGLTSAKDIRDFDELRLTHFYNKGYNVITIWCSDITKRIEEVKQKLSLLLKINIV